MLHTIPPVYDKNSKILILGSFPSVKSRESNFYYGNPQNRFWRILSGVIKCEVPDTVNEKRAMLLQNGIALWDVIYSCDIEGSEDKTICNVIPNDLSIITQKAMIKKVYTNGAIADRLYKKYCLKQTGITSIRLPSTSPANAQYGIEKLIQEWKVILNYQLS